MNIIATKVQNQHRYFTFYLYVYLCQLCAYNVLNYDVKKVMIYFILCKLWNLARLNLNNKPKLNRLLIENLLSLSGFVPTFKFIVECWYAIKSCHGIYNLILSNKVMGNLESSHVHVNNYPLHLYTKPNRDLK